MPAGDIPVINKSAYLSNNLDWGSVMGGVTTSGGTVLEDALIHRRVGGHPIRPTMKPWDKEEESETISTEQMIMNSQKRIVQIFIADPDINVPLDASLLYQSEKPFVTDLNDQELFFELPIKTILDTHNAKRTLLLDKAATSKSGKDVKLEPIKVRELRMTVVDIAKF